MKCKYDGCKNECDKPFQQECTNCWEVRRRLEDFLKSPENLQYTLSMLQVMYGIHVPIVHRSKQ